MDTIIHRKRIIYYKTPQEIYLEWCNDWLTTDKMAEYYGLPQKRLKRIINRGRENHEAQLLKNRKLMKKKILAELRKIQKTAE